MFYFDLKQPLFCLLDFVEYYHVQIRQEKERGVWTSHGKEVCHLCR